MTVSTRIRHAVPDVVAARSWTVPVDVPVVLDEAFVGVAGRAGRHLPAEVHDALVDFADRGHRSGALLLAGAPIGELPPTPETPTAATSKDLTSELTLLTVARVLGQPVGYRPEHGGRIVQNIVPTRGQADRQVSTSSSVDLMFHTETAFHPHRPRYLLLLCLRGDPAAVTTLASVHELLGLLDPATVDVLRQPRFRTAVDASFLAGRPNQLGAPRPVLEGTVGEPTFVFDADLMVGTDVEAESALRAVTEAVEACHTGVVLEPGQLLVVDNHLAIHGRSHFTPRFDGTDRWLQRTFVVSDLSPSAADRTGRVITTVFG